MKSLTINQKVGIVVTALLLTVVATFMFNYRVQVAKAFGFRYLPDQNTLATTTPTLLLNGINSATTTYNTDGAEMLSLFLELGASTTQPTLLGRVQFSPYAGVDCQANQAGCDWYDSDVVLSSLSTTTVHVQTGMIDSWVYSSTTANQAIVPGTGNVKFITKRLDILNLNSTYTRIIWSVTGANALLGIRSSLKNTIVAPR